MFVLLLVSVTIAAWDGSDEKSSRRILDVPDSFSFLATVSPCLWGSIPPARILYILCLYTLWMTRGMQNGQVPTSKVQFQLPVLWKEECAGACTYGPLRTDYELHFSAPHLWHHFGSWKSAFGSRHSTKSSKCYKSGPDIKYASWLKDTSTVAVTHAFLSMMRVRACVCVCVECVCGY